MGVFRFLAALTEWSENELNDVKRLRVQAYKNAWHLPRSTASALDIFPKTHAGKESTLPMAVLTQELLLHAICNSFAKLIEVMELWKRDDATRDFWSRLAKALQQSNVQVTWAEQLDSRLASVHAIGKMSWAAATRSVRECKMRFGKNQIKGHNQRDQRTQPATHCKHTPATHRCDTLQNTLAAPPLVQFWEDTMTPKSDYTTHRAARREEKKV